MTKKITIKKVAGYFLVLLSFLGASLPGKSLAETSKLISHKACNVFYISSVTMGGGDTVKPVITNPDADISNNVKVQIKSIFVDRTEVTDNVDNPILVVTNGPVNTGFMGTYRLTYNATDQSGNKAETKTYNYVVDDYIGPTIDLNTLDTIRWEVNNFFAPPKVTAQDNYYDSSQISLTKTSNVNPYKLGWYYEEYTATDGSGNITVRRRWVRVVDTEAPVINGKAKTVAKFSSPDFAFLSDGLTITDNYDAPVTLWSRLTIIFNNVNTSVDGLYVVTFKVSDFSGNWSLPFERIILVGSANVLKLDEMNGFNLYPNPSTGVVNISYNFATTDNMIIEVYNFTGEKIAHSKGISNIDLSNEANGLYTIRIKTSDRIFTSKVSIRK